MDKDRLMHSLAVARKMVEIGIEKGLEATELEELFVLGYVHDIGYEFAPSGKDHNKIGGNVLKQSDYKYWQEVYYHGALTEKYESLYLTILNQADMQIDKYGNDIGYEARLLDIQERYGEGSMVHERCYQLVKKIKDR